MRALILACGLALCLAPAAAGRSADAAAPAPADTTLRAAIDRELAAEAADVAVLSSRIAAAPDARAALALVKELEQRKRETARRLLELQLVRARARGDGEAVARLEAAIAGQSERQPGGAPATRPEPPAEGGKGGRP